MSAAKYNGHSRLSRAVVHLWHSDGRSCSARTVVGGFVANVFWDTNLFIYLLEDSPEFGQVVENLRRRMLRRNDRLFTTAMTVGEVLVNPLSTSDSSLADRYRAFLS